MKTFELLEQADRIPISVDQKNEIKKLIFDKLKLTDLSHVMYTGPQQASTFPGDIRILYGRNDPRYGEDDLEGGPLQVVFAKGATKQAFKKVMGFDVKVYLDKDERLNNLRYIDLFVDWDRPPKGS